MKRRRRAVAILSAVVLLAACAGDSGRPTPTSPPTQSASRSPAPSPTASSDGVALDEECAMETGDARAVFLQHPSGWELDSDPPCQFFDPESVDLPEDSEALDVDIRWDAEPVDYRTAAAPGEATEDEDRLTSTVDGHRAVRIQATSTGAAGLPEGVRTTTWLVDLDHGAGGDATLVGSTADVDGVDYDEAVDVLDAMARAARIGSDTSSPDQVTVARYAGGGQPFTVAYDDSNRCLTLYSGARQGRQLDEHCDVVDNQPLSAVVLSGGDLDVVMGLAAPEVDVVRLRANTDARRGAVTVPVADGVHAYGLPLSGTEVTVIAETFDGEEIDEVTVLPEAAGGGAPPPDDGVAMLGEPRLRAVEGGDFPRGRGEPALLTDVRVGRHDGFDRVVLEFRGDDDPTYRVTYIEPPVRQAGSGREVDVAGEAFLELQIQPASGYDLRSDEGTQVYEGQRRIDVGGKAVIEVVRTGDYEAHLTWVAGIRERLPFAVALLDNPLRLVVDVEHASDA